MDAAEELKKEHKVAELMLEVLEKISVDFEMGRSVNTHHVLTVLSFFRNFTGKLHHYKEEKLLFPVIRQAGARHAKFRRLLRQYDSKRAKILSEHAFSRTLVSRMHALLRHYKKHAGRGGRDFARTAKSYIILLRKHMRVESEVMLPLTRKLSSSRGDRKLMENHSRFKAENNKYPKIKEAGGVIKELKGIYLIS